MERIEATNEIGFRIGFSGYSGHLRIEPLSPVQSPSPLDSIPDFILPPAFPAETRESVKEYLEEKYLKPELDPDEFSVEKAGRFWEFDWFDKADVKPEPSAPRLVLSSQWELPFRRLKKNEGSDGVWDPASVEVDVIDLVVGDDSEAFARMPGPAKDFVRGSMNSRPFRPGGLSDSQSTEKMLPRGACNGNWVHELIDGGVSQFIPPGFKKGLDLGHLKEYPYFWKRAKGASDASEIMEEKNLNKFSVQFDDLFTKAWEEGSADELSNQDSAKPKSEEEESNIDEMESYSTAAAVESSAVDEILQSEGELVSKDFYGTSDSKQHEGEASKKTIGPQEIVARFTELVPDMALDFPFELDTFQKEAIYYLERGESVFVAAHTSAGKTVVAEYAFALASKHCTRAVYTAPIKTISNQKYRDFCGKFDVGLLTGDVSLRPEASCLIMTTEILRSMLYKGADIIRDIEWVIFDEVHYVNDVERGVVWEEVIIMLPKHINIVLLSATDNKETCSSRALLILLGELYKICENENFLHQGLRAAKEVHKKKNSRVPAGNHGMKLTAAQSRQHETSSRGRGQKHSGPQNTGNFTGSSGADQNQWGARRAESSLWLMLINKLSKMSLLPVVIFCFSKTRCDRSADSLSGSDLTSSSEKKEIRLFCDKAFSRLKGSDKNLPQVVRVQSLLRRGIGVHHAGLLPIVKEVVEMLFCRGVIKVLFSTETFAMGVNAPARTVVFDSLRKFDGKDFRRLLPGEYIQMAGRAGRRGLDKIGTVVVMCRDDIPEESDLKQLIVGKATRLESQFRLTYMMILHLLRVEELKVEDMLKRSFAEFHAQKNLPEKEKLLMLKLHQSTKSIDCIKGEPAIEEYYEMALEAEAHREHISEALFQSHAIQQFLSPGRLVIVRSESAEEHLLGVILKTPSASSKQYIVLVLTTGMASTAQNPSNSPNKLPGKGGDDLQGYFIVPKGKRGMDEDYFLPLSSRKGSGAINIKLPYRGTAAGLVYEVIGIEYKDIMSICDCKIKVDQVRLLEDPSTATYSKTVQLLLKEKPDGSKFPPPLDAVKDLKLKDVSLVESYYAYNSILQRLSGNKCHGCVKLKENFALVKEQRHHRDEVNALKYQMSDEALQQMPDFQGRIDVLKEISCIDSDLVVQIKGRVACEMNSGEELICTECLFENQLDELEPQEAVALMSAFVFQQKNASEPSLTPKLANAKKRLYETAIRLGQLQQQFKVAVEPEEYAQENLKFGLVEVVYEWAKGTPFADICELTDVPEGMIVRTIVRLDETCREFKNAASIMGNSALFKKMETASNAIKRDIVFAASLYITGV